MRQTFLRYERKYIIDDEIFGRLSDEINRYMTCDEYCADGKKYSVYNIYFDTETNDVIRHSVSSPYYKEKLRIRSYNEYPGEDDIVYLEIKKKTGKIVSKRRAVLTLRESRDFLTAMEIPRDAKYMQKQVLSEIKYFIMSHGVAPAVYIGYDRYAFFGKEDDSFRLTVDSNIRARRDSLDFSYGSGGTALLDDGKYLMEIKVSGAIPLWLAKKLSQCEVYSTSFSKYGKEYQIYLSGHGSEGEKENILSSVFAE